MLIAMAALAAVAWLVVVVRAWAPRARARGGFWYLEVLLFLSAPVLTTLIFYYPTDGSVGGPFPMVARLVTLVCVGLALWALLNSVTNARRGIGVVVAAGTAYYFAMVLSGVIGAVPGIPERYITTPVIVLAFIVHGGYTHKWFMWAARFNLRVILALSFLSVLVAPVLAFNTDESRTFLGVGRLEGIVGHPNMLGAVAVVALLLEIHGARSKFWMIVPVVALAFAQSNTSWIALGLALACYSGRIATALRAVAATAAITLAAIILILPALVAPVVTSLTEGDFTLNGRSKIWAAALEGFVQHPIFGYGPTLLGEDFRARYLPNFDAGAQAHNQFVQSIAEAGLVGVSTLLILLGVLIARAIKLRRMGIAAPLALLVSLVVRALTETPMRPSGPGLSTFLLVVVIVAVAVLWSEKRAPVSDDERDISQGRQRKEFADCVAI